MKPGHGRVQRRLDSGDGSLHLQCASRCGCDIVGLGMSCRTSAGIASMAFADEPLCISHVQLDHDDAATMMQQQ